MKIAAVVILYQPSPTVINNINTYAPFVERVYVIDNSESPSSDIVADINKNNSCYYFGDYQNKGIATRLNEACKMAAEHGFDWLLTMDQDSSFANSDIKHYLFCIDTFLQKNNVAMFGVEHNNKGLIGSTCTAVNTQKLITSGSIVNLHLFRVIGGFNESLFIDQVDFEYCYRSKLMSYQIILFENVFLKHFIGKQSNHRSLKSFRMTKRTLHHPVRLYYMTRNFLYIKSRYGKLFKKDISESRKDLIVRIKNNLLYGENKTEVIKYIIKGILHYRKKQMGKLC